MFRFLWLFFSLGLLAQQQIVPKDMNRKQKKLFEELTQAVSAPCCNNGIPVAFHMSPMANVIRDEIAASVMAGKTKSDIMAELAEATYGPNKQKLIFTVPSKTPVGYIAYILPLLAVLLGVGFVFAYRHRRVEKVALSDDELLDTYKDAILNRVGQG